MAFLGNISHKCAGCGSFTKRQRLWRLTSRRYIKTKPGRNLMSVSNPTLITFVIYIAAMVLIGFMAYRSTNNLLTTFSAVVAWAAWLRHCPPALPT
jgi:hypothetical protein